MNGQTLRFLLLPICVLLAVAPAMAQQHRAVRLGHPLTRFAAPLNSPEQLRALFADGRLQLDVAAILRQAGWHGDVQDLRRAAASAPLTELSLPVGTRMPFMASRRDGKPEALIDVLWDGEQPVSAYAFDFTSRGRRYRCIIPKPCSNFYTVDLGVARPELALACATPAQVLAGRRFDLTLSLVNTGTAPEPRVTVRLSLPPNARLTSATEQAAVSGSELRWTVSALQPAAAKEFTATFVAREPALLTFAAAAEDSGGKVINTRCDTRVAGIPAILLETADLDDPIEVGKEVIYEIKVTNQGSADGTNLKVMCALPESEAFVSGGGPTLVQAQVHTVTMSTLPMLAPKAQAVWRVTARALKADDARFKAFVSSDQFVKPIEKDEATHLY